MEFIKKEISENFFCFEQNHVRSFLLCGEPFSLLVDSCYDGEFRALCESIAGNQIRLILTHSDRDHIGCASQFEHRYMHPAEFHAFGKKHAGAENFLPVWDGDTFDIGTFRLEVIHLPGHTPGSIALLERDKKFLIAGDNVQSGPIYMFGEMRSLAAYAASMERLQRMRDSFSLCYSSHFDLTPPLELIPELYTLAYEMAHGVFPPEQPLPSPPPPSVPEDRHLYVKGGAKFYF